MVYPNLEIYVVGNYGKYYPRLARLTQDETTASCQLHSILRTQGGRMDLKCASGFIPLKVVLKVKQLDYITKGMHVGRRENSVHE